MQKAKVVKMNFICNQDWEEMKVSQNGRFCDVCKQEVYDFTDKNFNEINTVKKSLGSACGRFRADQIDHNLTNINLSPLKKNKYWLATLITFFGLEFSKLNSQTENIPKTEIRPDTSNITHLSLETQLNDLIVADSSFVASTKYPGVAPKPFMTTRRYAFYWSKRFPFIVRRRQFYGGRF